MSSNHARCLSTDAGDLPDSTCGVRELRVLRYYAAETHSACAEVLFTVLEPGGRWWRGHPLSTFHRARELGEGR